MIDRFTRWPEAVPMIDASAESVSRAFYNTWVTRFGAPARITTDQGRQFESRLFRCLAQLLGIQRSRSSPYHPQANGLIEQLHRPLKAALKAHCTPQWTTALPTILLGFRAAFKEDILATTAELVYGQTLRLPGELFQPTPVMADPKLFVEELKTHFTTLRPVPTSSHGTRPLFVHPRLQDCTHVFVRNDGVRTPLHCPYDGPFPVIRRGDKTFDVAIRQRKVTLSLDRLKPAFLAADRDDTTTPPARPQQPLPPSRPRQEGTPTANDAIVTRSGRTSVKPKRFVTFNLVTARGVCGARQKSAPKKEQPSKRGKRNSQASAVKGTAKNQRTNGIAGEPRRGI